LRREVVKIDKRHPTPRHPSLDKSRPQTETVRMNTAAAMRHEPETASEPSATGAGTAATGASHAPAAAPAAVTGAGGTNQPPTTPTNRRAAMRQAFENGDTVANIARAFSVSEAYAFKVRKAGNWQRNAPLAQAGPSQVLATKPPDGAHPGEETNLPTIQTNQDPTSAAVAQTVAGLITAALPTIAPPRNLRELGTAVEIYRKVTGLDRPQGGNGPRVLINLNAGIRVRERVAAQVVDVDAAGE